jgi:putative ABC transport system permease protein
LRLLLRATFLRPVRRNPARFLVTVVGVAAGIASLVATISANRAAVASMQRGVEELAGPTAVELTAPGGVPESLLATLRPLTDEAVVAPVVDRVALLPALDDAVRVLGIDPLLVNPAEESPGAAPPSEAAVEAVLRGEAVLVPAPLARRLHLAAGDRLELSIRSRKVLLAVAGVIHPPRLATVWDRTVVADVAQAQEWFGMAGRLDRIELRPRSGNGGGGLAARARALVGPRVTISSPRERAARTSNMVRALEFNLTALSGISLLVGAVLVATTLATSVVQRREVIALLRSLGASRRQITSAVLTEAAVIAVLGGVLGVGAGILGARAALASVRATVAAVVQGLPSSEIVLGTDVAIGGLLTAILVSLLAAVLPLREAQRTPPIQGLLHERPQPLAKSTTRRAVIATIAVVLLAAALTRVPAIHDLPIAALLASLALLGAVLIIALPLVDRLAALAMSRALRFFGPPLRLAAAVLEAGRTRAAWAAGALGITVALAVAVTVLVHSFRQTVVDWANESLRSDIWVRPMAASTGFGVGTLDPEVVRIAERLFGPDEVDPFYMADATIDGHPVTLGAGAFAVVARWGGVPFVSGRDSHDAFRRVYEEDGAVINEPLATRLGLKEGDRVTIRTGGYAISKRIVDVFYDYSHGEGMIVINVREYQKMFPRDGPAEMGLYLPPGSDVPAARERFLHALGGRFLVEAFLNRELRHEVVALFDQTFAIAVALRVVAAVVAVIAVVTVLFALIGERRRELAVVRTLGGSRGQLVAIVLVQAVLLGVAGVVTGVAAGGAVGLVLVKIVNLQSFAWTLRFIPPWTVLATTVVWLLAACLAAGAAPALSAMRTTVREGLREES